MIFFIASIFLGWFFFLFGKELVGRKVLNKVVFVVEKDIKKFKII